MKNVSNTDDYNVLANYRKVAMMLISAIFCIAISSAVVACIGFLWLNIFQNVPKYIHTGFIVLGTLEVIGIVIATRYTYKNYNKATYDKFKIFLLATDIINYPICLLILPTRTFWTSIILFVLVMGLLQEHKLTVIAATVNSISCITYIAFNWLILYQESSLVGEVIGSVLSFILNLSAAIIYSYMTTTSLTNISTGMINNTLEKLTNTMSNVEALIPNLTENSTSLLEATESEKDAIELIVGTTNEITQGTSLMTELTKSNQETMNQVYYNALTVSDKINTVSSTYSHLVDTIVSETEVLHTIESESNQVVDATRDIHNVTKDLKEKVASVNAVSEVIKKISAETKILALNALIEAARVGDLGKGFAVVANRVKELAQSTADAVMSIDDIVNSINIAMVNVNSSVDNSIDKIVSQSDKISLTTKVMTDVADNIKETLTYLDDMKKLSNEHTIYTSKAESQNKDVLSNISKQNSLINEVNEQAVSNLADIEDVLACVMNLNNIINSISQIVEK